MAVRTPRTDAPHPDTGAGPARRIPAVVGGAVVLAAGVYVAATLSLTHDGEGVAGVLAALLRVVRYLGALLAVGGFVFVAAVRPPALPVERRGRTLTLLAAGASAAASLVTLPVQAAYLSGRTAAAVDGSVVATVAASGFGQSVVLGLGGLALLALGVVRAPAPAALGAGAAGCVLALGAFLLTGHSVVSEPQAVALPANLAHTAAAAVWLGGLALLPLALAERRTAGDAVGGARLVARFSTAATVAVLVVAAGGATLAWVEVRALSALATPYGAVLLTKAALVAAVAALGAYNNRRLVPAVRRGDGEGWARLSRIVRLETIGLVGAVAVTAVLVNVVPARVEAGVDAQVVRTAALGAERTVTLVVEPARPGSNEVHVFVEDASPGEALVDLTVGFVPPGAGDAAATVTPTRVGPGHWLHLGGELTDAGQWRLELTGHTGDGGQEQVTVTIPVTTVDDWEGL